MPGGLPFAGKDGYVEVNTVRYEFGEWSLDMETDAVIYPHFEDGGFDHNLEGRSRAVLTLAGPLMTGAMALTSGTLYDFVLGVGGAGVSAVEFPVTARVNSIRPKTKTDSKEPAGVEVKAVVHGSFTKAIA